MERLKYIVRLYSYIQVIPLVSCMPSAIDCEKDCRGYTDPNYKPQDCALLCKNKEVGEVGDAMEDIFEEVSSLRLMVIILIALVIFLILLVAGILAKDAKIKGTLAKYYRKMRNNDSGKREKNCHVKEGDTVIANYTSSYSPPIRRDPPMTSSIRCEAPPVLVPQFPLEAVKSRVRMPSESTCPDDSHHVQDDSNGYDNLALSTSSISFSSRPSSPSSPVNVTSSSDTVGVSIATLDTTMTTVHLDSANGRRSTTPNHHK